ncbi:MAG: AAA family ATPase [Candidatus Marinimicrobia bacterium]|nr:AAA family ATPase [Candidatus Neomarinimicrobiota bacterium]
MKDIQKILETIKSCSQKAATKLIAVDGFGGSGKSTLTEKLVELYSSIKVVGLDKFPCLPTEHSYHSVGAQTRINLERFQNEVLIPLSEGKEARFQNTFWWPTDQAPERFTVQPGEIVLIEGCYSFHKDIRHFYDLSIWVDCAPDEAMERAVARDGESGRSLWEEAHAPNERQYVAAQQPQKYVDLIVFNVADKSFFIKAEHIT